MTRLACATLTLILLLIAAVPARADLCASLPVPEELELACTATGERAASIGPREGLWSALSRLDVRELDRGTEPDAWTEPNEWLRRQVSFDLSGLIDTLRTQAGDPDSPFGNSAIDTTLAGIASAIEEWAKVAESGCTAPEQDGARVGTTCRWEAGPLGLGMFIRVVSAGERRYAIRGYAMNEIRLRHFTAIANGFSAPPA